MRCALVALRDTAGVIRLGLMRDDLVCADGTLRIRVICVMPRSNVLEVAVISQDKPLFADVDSGTDASVTDLDRMTAA